MIALDKFADAKALNIKDVKPMKYGFGVFLVSDYRNFMSKKVEDSLNEVLLNYEKQVVEALVVDDN